MPSAPCAPRRPFTIEQHGQTRNDDYFWIRYREDPAVMEYVDAENAYLEEMTQHTRELREQLFQEMKARIKEDDATAPERNGEDYFYTRTEAGKQYPIFCRKHGTLEAPEEILLDQNKLAEGKTFCRVGAFAVSPDRMKLAYSIDPDGSEACNLYIKDLASGALYPEVIANTFASVYDHSGVEWAADSQTLFYVKLDAASRPFQLYRHQLGSDPAQDALLYHEADESYFMFLVKSRSKAYIAAHSRSYTADEWRLLPADQPEAELKLFDARRRGVEYSVEHLGERFYIVTNENAQNFKLMATSLEHTTHEHWTEVLPHRADTLVRWPLAFENNLVLFERKDGLGQIRISAADGVSEVRYVSFPEPVYAAYPTGNPEYHTPLLRFRYTSLVTPNSIIDYHMDSGDWELKKRDEIPSGYDPALYTSERLHAIAPDGKRVPMSIIYRKGLRRDGQNPTLLYGYGSYGATIDPGFDPNRFSLIDRGFVYAIGHVRGGSDLGRAWYEDGKMLNKRNTFTDFIACAECLIADGFTSKDKLSILGASAGGLLVGACLTMRPDLYKAVVAKVPFVDMVSTMSDPTIPLTTLEYDQWGNPDDKVYFDYMMSYSPYDNIRPAEYPSILITTGMNDPRVAYWEPLKFAAKLRSLKQDDHPLLLKVILEAGHAGASGRYDQLKETAFDYAFLIDQVGTRKNA